MKKNIILILLSCVTAFSSHIYPQNKIGKHVNDPTVDDSAIVAPEHLTKKLAELLHDWQIDFTASNNQCEQGTNITFDDSVYTRRLYEFPTEMELSFNQVVKKYIEMYTQRKRELVAYMLTVGNYYFPMFEEALDKEGIPLELKYLPVIESALNPVAVSRAGATGLWQFMLRTGQGYGLQVNSLVDERRDPHKSTAAAAKYLKDLYAIYEDWNLVIAAYNCGPGNVNKAITRSGGKRDYWEIYYHLPKETRGYVPAFIAANYVMSYYDKHNICPIATNTELFALDTLHVNQLVHFNQISDVLNIPMSDLKRWNPQFKRDQIPGNFKEYALVLPTNMIYAYLEKQEDIVNYKRNEYQPHRLNTDSYIASENTSTTSGNTENVYYRVKSGDNLGKIASRNGVSVAQLRSWNNLKTSKIAIGKSLIVKKRIIQTPNPEDAAETLLAQQSTEKRITTRSVNEYYRVRNGDNLGRIASRNGVTVAQLKSWNGLRTDRLSVGKSLIVKKGTETIEEEIEIENTMDENAPEPIEGYQKEEMEVNVPQIIEVGAKALEVMAAPMDIGGWESR